MARHSMLESNIIDSFNKVKSDVMKLNSEIQKLGSAVVKVKDEQERNSRKDDKQQEKRLKELEEAISALVFKNKSLIQKIEGLEKKKNVRAVQKMAATTVVTKKVTGKQSSKFIASKSGNKFHLPNCIFAKNIKPKMKRIFKTKAAALNVGLKPCHCALKM